VDAQLLHTVPTLKAIAAGETTGAPVTSVDSVLRLAMQHVVPGSNESMLGFINGKPALVPAVNLPFRIDKDSALVARIVSEANPTRVVIGTAKSPLGTLRYLIIPVRVAGYRTRVCMSPRTTLTPSWARSPTHSRPICASL
jgi:two-component system, OmpR family, sensor kinase